MHLYYLYIRNALYLCINLNADVLIFKFNAFNILYILLSMSKPCYDSKYFTLQFMK